MVLSGGYEMEIKKPFKTGGDFYRGSDFEILKLTKSEVLLITKKTRSRLGLNIFCKHIKVNDFGEYWTSSIW